MKLMSNCRKMNLNQEKRVDKPELKYKSGILYKYSNLYQVHLKDVLLINMKKISGAEAIIRCLISEDIDVLFVIWGAIMPVYDELYKFQNIKSYSC